MEGQASFRRGWFSGKTKEGCTVTAIAKAEPARGDFLSDFSSSAKLKV
jgi:hypothetical protein